MVDPEAARPADPVGLVLRALAFGAAVGVGAQALVTWGVRAVQSRSAPASTPSLTSGAALLLLLGTLAGILVAAAASWSRLTPLGNPWRQAMLALIAGLGSFVLSLATIPIDRGLGPAGLLGLAAVSLAVAFAIGKRTPAGAR